MTKQELKEIVDRLADPQQRLEFYRRLKNPKLFSLLKQIYVFDDPPSVRIDGEQKHFPIWPQAKYLINVADSVPEEVGQLIRDIKTDNPAVAIDLCRAMQKMPASVVRMLLEPLGSWVGLEGGLILYGLLDIVDLLAKGGENTAALSLARSIASVKPGDKFEIASMGYSHVDAVAVVGDHDYPYAIKRVLEAVTDANPLAAVKMLSELLAAALKIENASVEQDISSTWIQDLSREPIGIGAKEYLANSLHAQAVAAAAQGVALESLYAALAREFPIFKRIRAALAIQYDDEAEARRLLAEPWFYRLSDLVKERSEVLAKFYPRLEARDRSFVLQHIQAGVTPRELATKHFGQWFKGEELENAVRDALDEERYRELLPISPFLDGDDAAKFASLVARFAREEQPGPKNGEVWVGPTSPKSPEELQELSAAQILDFTFRWVPKRGVFENSPEGFGRVLESVVTRRAGEFVQAGAAIANLHPTYVRYIVSGLRQRLGTDDFTAEAFVGILEIAAAVATKSASSDWATEYGDEETAKPASALRQVIAFALSDLFRARNAPPELRARVFAVLLQVLGDPDPDTEADERYGLGSAYGPATQLALNSARGAGMLALFEYSRWVYSQLRSKEGEEQLLQLAPEVSEVLGNALDAANEPTAAIRSVLGQNFVSLYAMSQDWARKNSTAIFSDDRRGDAAWRAYLAFNRCYNDIFWLLEDRYEVAVAALPVIEAEDDGWDVTNNLGVHIATAYVRELIGLDSDLIAAFFRNAPPKPIGHVLHSMGASLGAGDVPDVVYARYMALYDFVLSNLREQPLEARYEALEKFGIWVLAPKLQKEWLFDRLIETLKLTGGRIAYEFRGLEILGELANAYPLECSKALYELTFGSYSSIFMADSAIRSILSSAAHSSPEAHAVAVSVNNRFADMGIERYHDVFDNESDSRGT